MREIREPWPLPDRTAQRRTSNAASLALGGVVAVALGLAGAMSGASLGEWRERSVPDRLKSIIEGQDEFVSAAVFGTAGWCPRFPDWGMLRLSAGDITYDQGVARVIPVQNLRPVAVRSARSVAAPLKLRRGWVLDLAGPDGTGSIALRFTEDLALLGAVAGWPPAPGWPH